MPTAEYIQAQIMERLGYHEQTASQRAEHAGDLSPPVLTVQN